MPRRRSGAYNFAKTTWKYTDKAATGLTKWSATDHYGLGQSLDYMPKMGFVDTMKYILVHFLFSILGAVLSAAWIVFLLFIVLPYLLFGTTLIP